MPCAMLSRICTSRGESGANTCELPGPYTESSRNSASTFVATAGLAKIFSLMMNWPPRTLRIDSTDSFGAQSLWRYAAAPARIASSSDCSSSTAVRITTAPCGRSRRTFCVAFTPESSGRSTSMMRTSGSSSIVLATASSPSVTSARISMSASFSRTAGMARVVRRLAAASTMRMAFSGLTTMGLSAKRVPLLIDAEWKEECNRGALSGRRLHLQSRTDELGAFAHREQADRSLTARDLHQVEADAVVGAVHHPLLLRLLPHDADGRRLRVLVHVLQRLLHHPVDRELLRGVEAGVTGIEVAVDAEPVARLVLRCVVADRSREPELGEDRWPEVVDHAAHRVERGAELALQIRELRLQRGARLAGRAVGDALEVLDLEHRVREDLGRTVVHVAVESLALGLEALEDALGDGDAGLLLLVELRRDARAAKVRGARLDVADRELELLQPAERALRGFVGGARRARLRLRALLVGLLELLALLPEAAHVTAKPVDDEVEEAIKVVLARNLRGRALVRGRMVRRAAERQGTSMSTKVSDEARIGQPRSRARTATGSVGRARIWRMPRRAMTSRHPGWTPTTVV